MKFPLTQQLIDEARRFNLRSSCQHCFYFSAADQRCKHDWPNDAERRWPLDAKASNGETPTEVAFCKEFEMR